MKISKKMKKKKNALGYRLTEGHKKSISERHKGKKLTKEHIDKLSRKGSKHTAESRNKISKNANPNLGEEHQNSKLTEKEVLQIVDMYEKGLGSQQTIANHFNVSGSTVGKIVRGITWGSVTGLNKNGGK